MYSIRTLPAGTLSPFSQYFLPQTLLRSRQEEVTFLGAVWDRFACGGAAVAWHDGYAELLSLFIDPQTRRKGVATALIEEIGRMAAARALTTLTASYVQREEELAALDGFFDALGAEVEVRAPVCRMDSTHFEKDTFASVCFQGAFRSPQQVVPFSRLTPEQLSSLGDEDIPDQLSPAALRRTMDPSLSFAWVKDGAVVAFVLGCCAGEGDYSMQALWRSEEKSPAACAVSLIKAQINACYYHGGGPFFYSISPVSQSAKDLADALTGGDYTLYEEHAADLALPMEDGE